MCGCQRTHRLSARPSRRGSPGAASRAIATRAGAAGQLLLEDHHVTARSPGTGRPVSAPGIASPTSARHVLARQHDPQPQRQPHASPTAGRPRRAPDVPMFELGSALRPFVRHLDQSRHVTCLKRRVPAQDGHKRAEHQPLPQPPHLPETTSTGRGRPRASGASVPTSATSPLGPAPSSPRSSGGPACRRLAVPALSRSVDPLPAATVRRRSLSTRQPHAARTLRPAQPLDRPMPTSPHRHWPYGSRSTIRHGRGGGRAQRANSVARDSRTTVMRI
ncbi:hypothetical protein FB559_0522 [Actinoallomurus bryophytorum]|uniref:Uncharacterized protein n=1 Tax=Actinoallomurus bryophytorum TaxID=1490222 RepID=A0A543CD59_9ACTN|nr:hypothetical protein FB559_0522 [Actinoallomurus bryophytorum]